MFVLLGITRVGTVGHLLVFVLLGITRVCTVGHYSCLYCFTRTQTPQPDSRVFIIN